MTLNTEVMEFFRHRNKYIYIYIFEQISADLVSIRHFLQKHYKIKSDLKLLKSCLLQNTATKKSPRIILKELFLENEENTIRENLFQTAKKK